MPYLDSFPIPNIPEGAFLVTPLYVDWDIIPLETINQTIDFIHQILEVTRFIETEKWILNIGL